MSGNHHREVQAMRWRLMALVLLGVSLVAILTVGIVLQRQRHQRLGFQKVTLEQQVRRLQAQVQILREQRARVSSTEALRTNMVRFGLALTNVTSAQRLFVERRSAPVVTLPLPPGSSALSPVPPLAAGAP